MPHADFSYTPPNISTKTEFWSHVYEQLKSLLEGQRNWVSNCANAASLIYNSLASFHSHFGSGEKAVNWCGVYIDSNLFPQPRLSATQNTGTTYENDKLLLGPFSGKPACQFIDTEPEKARGVCADAYMQGKTVLVPEVDKYPGHIACDGETKSEIVCPLLFDGRSIGVLDLDCLAMHGFDEEDKTGLERIAKLMVQSSDW